MDPSVGYQIEVPEVFVPWGIDEQELLDLLPQCLHRVADGYLVADCISLSGLEHALGFHFRPRSDGSLVELEFFHREPRDLGQSFAEFQDHLERTFGPPDRERPGVEGCPSFRWVAGEATITHHVLYRFGPEQHVRIVCARQPSGI